MGGREPKKIADGLGTLPKHLTYASLSRESSSHDKVYIEVTEPWNWTLPRGVLPFKTVLPQGTAMYDSLVKLGWGPLTLTAQAPCEPGTIEPKTKKVKIKELYLETGVKFSARHMGVTLYDKRILLDGKVFPFDINRIGTDRQYTAVNSDGDGNENQGTTETPMTALEAIRLALKFYDFEIHNPISGKLLKDNPVVPDNKLFHGSVSLVEGLTFLFSLISWDMSVGIDGEFYFCDRDTETPLNLKKYYFKEELPDGESVFVNGVPKKIRVLFEKYQEQKMTYMSPASTSSGSTDGHLQLVQVYQFPSYDVNGTIITEAKLPAYITTVMTEAAKALGGMTPDRDLPISISTINQNFLDDAWAGTLLQTSPYEVKNQVNSATEVRLSALAKEIVAVIARDHRTLYRMTYDGGGDDLNIVSNLSTWDNMIFGVLGLNSKGIFTITTDADGKAVGSVNGEYSIVYSTPVGHENVAFTGGEVIEMASNFSAGPIPVTPVRIDAKENQLLFRLTASSTDFAATQVFPGKFSTLPAVTVAKKVESDLVNAFQISQTVTQWLTPRQGVLADTYDFNVFVVARRRTGTMDERFYTHEIETKIEGADRDELILTATTSASAFLKHDSKIPNNLTEIEEEAKTLTAPLIARYNGKLTGDCEIHGVEPITDFTHPQGQIDSMTIAFWAYGPTITTRLSVTDVVDGGDAIRAKSEKRRSDGMQNRSDRD